MSKYINIKESKFVRPHACEAEGDTYATDSDKIITICIDDIVSIHSESIPCSRHRYCTITLSNRSRYDITETTADEIRLYLDIDNVYERGEE